MPRQKKQIKSKRAPAKQPKETVGERKRLSPEVRRAQIMDAAARLIIEQGFLPLPIERLAGIAGTSKALIYSYFPTQYDIFNALLQRELQTLKAAGLETASNVQDLDQAVLLSAMLYFEHVLQSGPLLQILITDLYMDGHINREVAGEGEIMLSRFTRLARDTLSLPKKEIVAAIDMIAVIPQNAGSLAFHKEVEPSVARQACHTLLLSCLKSLRSIDASAV